MKTIITHISLDMDAITSTWLIKRFLPEWDTAEIEFVPAGSTFNNMSPDENPNIIHVDTGLGRFDHHQTQEYTSASRLVLEYLIKQGHIAEKKIEPLERMINFVNDIDHFSEVNFPDPTSDRYDFSLHQIIEGLKSTIQIEQKILNLVYILLDTILLIFKKKVRAERDIEKGFIFKNKWGKSIALETSNEEAMKLSMKMGYVLVIRKDAKSGHARIKTLPEKKYDLTPIFKKIKEIDKKGTWFLHISHNMLLNSSSKNPNFVPTPLTLDKLIDIAKGV